MNKKTLYLCHGALIATLYVILTHFSNLFGLAGGVIQIRLSEMLTVLPFFTPAAVWGLFAGCVLANITTGCAIWDVIFGSVATLLGALGSRYLAGKMKSVWVAPLFPIISNTLIIPFVLRYVYGCKGSLIYFMLTVFIGELISAGIGGMILGKINQKYHIIHS